MRISGIYVHTGIRQLVFTEELFYNDVVNNNKTIFYLLLLN